MTSRHVTSDSRRTGSGEKGRNEFPLQTRTLPANRHSRLVKVAQWVYYPPASFVLLLEVVVVFLLLRLWWC